MKTLIAILAPLLSLTFIWGCGWFITFDISWVTNATYDTRGACIVLFFTGWYISYMLLVDTIVGWD